MKTLTAIVRKNNGNIIYLKTELVEVLQKIEKFSFIPSGKKGIPACFLWEGADHVNGADRTIAESAEITRRVEVYRERVAAGLPIFPE